MFTRKKVTIPSAGDSQVFELRGVSIIVEDMPTYSNPDEVPLLSFGDSSNTPQPLYGQSVYQSDDGFERIAITGTSESAGDILYLLASDQCLAEDININVAGSGRATLKPTFKKDMTDTPQALGLIDITNARGALATAMYVTPVDSDCRFAFDSDPQQGADPRAHVIKQDETLKVEGINFIEAFRFLSSTASGGGSLTFTLEY